MCWKLSAEYVLMYKTHKVRNTLVFKLNLPLALQVQKCHHFKHSMEICSAFKGLNRTSDGSILCAQKNRSVTIEIKQRASKYSD